MLRQCTSHHLNLRLIPDADFLYKHGILYADISYIQEYEVQIGCICSYIYSGCLGCQVSLCTWFSQYLKSRVLSGSMRLLNRLTLSLLHLLDH